MGLAPYDAQVTESAAVEPPPTPAPLRLHPFRALGLSPIGVGDPASAQLFARPYSAVPDRVTRWLSGGRLLSDADPAVYLHEYTAGGVTVRGLVGALDLGAGAHGNPLAQPPVVPHEAVHPEQVAELAERMEEMGINPAPILLVHRGPESVRRLVRAHIVTPPDVMYTDRSGQVQRIWALRDPDGLGQIQEGLRGSRALIADGHHRYAAYLQLAAHHPDSPWARGLAMLVDQSDTPLWLGAIHRFIAGRPIEQMVELLSGLEDVECVFTDRGDALSRLGARTLVITDDRQWAALRLPEGDDLAVGTLETSLLPDLGIARRAVSFHHTVEDALRQARTRTGVCVLMPSPGFDAVVDSAVAGHLLPEKATSFQPKPSLGVMMRNLLDE